MAATFQIQPIGRASTVSLTLISVGCVALGALAWAFRSMQVEAMAVATVATLGLAGLFAWFVVAQRRSSVTIKGLDLVLQLPLYSRTINLDRLIPESLTLVDTNAGGPYQLTWRSNGLSVPGYNLGWFRTKDAGNVLAVTTRNEAVACKTKDDYALLISVADADGFMRRIREAAQH